MDLDPAGPQKRIQQIRILNTGIEVLLHQEMKIYGFPSLGNQQIMTITGGLEQIS